MLLRVSLPPPPPPPLGAPLPRTLKRKGRRGRRGRGWGEGAKRGEEGTATSAACHRGAACRHQPSPPPLRRGRMHRQRRMEGGGGCLRQPARSRSHPHLPSAAGSGSSACCAQGSTSLPCPRWPPQLLHVISTRRMPMLVSTCVSTELHSRRGWAVCKHEHMLATRGRHGRGQADGGRVHLLAGQGTGRHAASRAHAC